MRYNISWVNPQQHFITFECIIENVSTPELHIQQPAWRPGRYELGNFAKNVRNFRVTGASGNALAFTKTAKDHWVIATAGATTVHVHYEYYAADLNAGSTFLDESQLYMNPVNCCMYVPDRMHEEHRLVLDLPDDYRIACALPQPAKNELVAGNFDRLADSPFIASATLKHQHFVLDGVGFHLWFQGECKPDWPKIIADFFIFVNEQMMMMKTFPAGEYHFFFQILPMRFYHGVEHLDSTVIALGPSYKLMSDVYHDFLGVSSHELFHAWNIKAIRPAEMYPYDFTKENYSRLGYVCEGVTTYYGDYLLYRSTVYSEAEYWQTFAERMQKHFDNPGRFSLSVADSSFETWLDGYVPGIPGRKTSIYDEGCLLAFVTDMLIRKSTNNDCSLDDVMRLLYTEFAQQGKGYTESDYQALVERVAGVSFDNLFKQYFYTAADYTPILTEALDYIGYKLVIYPSARINEHLYGFKVLETAGVTKVAAVYPGSPAELAGLAPQDDVLAVNNMPVKNDLNDWMRYFGKVPLELLISSGGRTKIIMLEAGKKTFYGQYKTDKSTEITPEQQTARDKWCGKRVSTSF